MRQRSAGITVAAVIMISAMGFAQRAGNPELQSAVHEAETEFRQQLNEYSDRLKQINWSNVAQSPQTRQAVHQTIVNGYDSHLKGMTRQRDQADQKISHMNVPAAVKNNALNTIKGSYASNAHTLRMREDDAMNKLNRASAGHR